MLKYCFNYKQRPNFAAVFTLGEELAKVSDAGPDNQRLFFAYHFQSGLSNIFSKLSSLSIG